MASESELVSLMFAAFQRGEGDVKVVARLGGAQIYACHAHKCVLTLQSEFFRGCLGNAANFKEGKDGEVVIELELDTLVDEEGQASAKCEVKCLAMMEQLFHFLYNGSFEEKPLEDFELAKSLFRLLDYLGVRTKGFAPCIPVYWDKVPNRILGQGPSFDKRLEVVQFAASAGVVGALQTNPKSLGQGPIPVWLQAWTSFNTAAKLSEVTKVMVVVWEADPSSEDAVKLRSTFRAFFRNHFYQSTTYNYACNWSSCQYLKDFVDSFKPAATSTIIAAVQVFILSCMSWNGNQCPHDLMDRKMLEMRGVGLHQPSKEDSSSSAENTK